MLDEPNNDLDIETLEVLEELLMDYTGTLLLVSHDRAFLNNLVTSTLALDENGRVKEYIGGYDDWRQEKAAQTRAAEEKTIRDGVQIQPEISASKRKPGYKEQHAIEAEKRELDELPGRIEALEAEQHQLSASMADSTFYQREASQISQAMSRLKDLEDELAAAYRRWEELERR